MKRLLLWATWLYPPRWRARYRGELEALIEDSGRAGWGELIDLLKGAIAMNFRELPPAKVIGFATYVQSTKWEGDSLT